VKLQAENRLVELLIDSGISQADANVIRSRGVELIIA